MRRCCATLAVIVLSALSGAVVAQTTSAALAVKWGIEQLMQKADNIIIGGGMAFTFIKAMGGHIGKSLCEDDRIETAKELIQKAKAKGI